MRDYGINPVPSNDLLGFFSTLQNRIFLVNPGHNLIIILDKLRFIGFFSVCCAYTREGLNREGKLIIYILIKMEKLLEKVLELKKNNRHSD